MKRPLITVMLVMVMACATACASEEKIQSEIPSTTNETAATAEPTEAAADVPAISLENDVSSRVTLEWPDAANQLGLPEPGFGTIISSATSPISNYKDNIILEIEDASEKDIEGYLAKLDGAGFIPGEAIGGSLLTYTKETPDASIELTLSVDSESGTLTLIAVDLMTDITADNYQPAENLSVSEDVPKEVPAFDGELIDTQNMDMGDGNMIYYMIYSGVTQEQVDAYKLKLENEGFANSDEGYILEIDGYMEFVMVQLDLEGDRLSLGVAKISATSSN